jgi:NAD(P)-dependent dehydrogenase (short-subunit alcohol dehydrogenase family)
VAQQEKWTAADIPDQSGGLAVVTGATSGLGFRTARELARAGAHVIVTARNRERGEEAAARIRDSLPGARVDVEPLDLADLSSARAFADRFAERHQGLDLLVNNAGVMALPRSLTADGFEVQLGTNHLGHFALTGLLLERLRARPEPRVVTVSSEAHRTGRINFDDLQGERGYSRWLAYGQSKLANLLFAYELQRRADATGTPLKSLAAHPGYSATNLQSGASRAGGGVATAIEGRFMALTNRLLAQSDEMGALPILYAATVPELPGGAYVGPDGPFQARGHPTLVDSSRASKDPALARHLWEVSEELTGVRFGLEPPQGSSAAGQGRS